MNDVIIYTIVLIFLSGVRLLFKGKIYGNNSLFFINEIGRTNSSCALQCVTDQGICCRQYYYMYIGEWYFPDGSIVPREDSATDFYRNRANNPGTVNLNRVSNAIISPTGQYCCHVPDNTTINQILCAYIGKYNYYIIIIIMIYLDLRNH